MSGITPTNRCQLKSVPAAVESPRQCVLPAGHLCDCVPAEPGEKAGVSLSVAFAFAQEARLARADQMAKAKERRDRDIPPAPNPADVALEWLAKYDTLKYDNATKAKMLAALIAGHGNDQFDRGRQLATKIWGDEKDEWTEEIDAAFPTRSGSHEEYGQAMTMVSHRFSKGSLVALVNWLLVRLRLPSAAAILLKHHVAEADTTFVSCEASTGGGSAGTGPHPVALRPGGSLVVERKESEVVMTLFRK